MRGLAISRANSACGTSRPSMSRRFNLGLSAKVKVSRAECLCRTTPLLQSHTLALYSRLVRDSFGSHHSTQRSFSRALRSLGDHADIWKLRLAGCQIVRSPVAAFPYTLIPAGRKLDVPHCRQQSDMLQLPEYTLTFNDKDFLLEGTSRKLSE